MTPFENENDRSEPLQFDASGWNEKITGLIQVGIIVGVVLIAILINLFLSLGDSGPQRLAVGEQTIAVEVDFPALTEHAIFISETGNVQVRSPVNISPQVGGRVVSVSSNFATGGVFSADEELFQIDRTDYEVALFQAEATLSSARSSYALEQAEAELARNEWALLNPDEDIPDLVARIPQLQGAKSAVAAAEAGVENAKTNLLRTSYSLPFDGRITQTSIEVGATLSANQNYGSAYRLEGIEVFVSMPEKSLRALSPVVGREVVVMSRQDDYQETGVVVRQQAQLDQTTRLAGLFVNFDKPTEFLPGSFVEVVIQGDLINEAYSVPISALYSDDSVWIVADGKLSKRFPEILSRYPDRVVTEPFYLADGLVITQLFSGAEGLSARVLSEEAPGPAPR